MGPSLRVNLSPTTVDSSIGASSEYLSPNRPPRINQNNRLQRSHSHQSPSSITSNGNNSLYRTHHIVANPSAASTVAPAAPPSVISDVHSVSGQSVYSSHPSTATAAATTNPEALYAMQQMQRIKAATACQIINNRV